MFDDNKERILLVAAIIIVAGVVTFATIYRHKETIIINKRYYTYVKAYKWDEDYYVSVSKESCTGTGKNKKCTTNTSLERRTSTNTRCEEVNVGLTLPPKPPEMTCSMRSGDYVTESVAYAIVYHTENNNNGMSYFDVSKWNELPLESKQVIVTDIFNRIIEVKHE